MKALILAAGKGTRLKHLTANYPKPMLPVGGKPLLGHWVQGLRQHGITQIAMNLNHRPETIIKFFGDGSRYGTSIVYSHEEQLMGTAGAAKRLESFLDETFVVVYGDVFTNFDLSRLMNFHRKKCEEASCQAALTLALYAVPNPSECGLVELDNNERITRFVEKPPPDQVFTNLANAGIMVMDPSLLSYIPTETIFDFGHDLYPQLLEMDIPMFGQTIAQNEYLIDIGTPMGYYRAQQQCRARYKLDTSKIPAISTI